MVVDFLPFPYLSNVNYINKMLAHFTRNDAVREFTKLWHRWYVSCCSESCCRTVEQNSACGNTGML